jgi:peroxiredoxin Q/BCP
MKILRYLPILALALLLLWRTSVVAMADELKVGEFAPNFSLMGSDGKTHTLEEYRGKAVVLAWFPKAFTSGCTAECKSMGESAKSIRGYDVVFFAISVDNAQTNKKFADNLKLTFPVLADPTKTTANSYGVIGVLPFARRWTFYIDKTGHIAAIDKSVKPATAGADLKAELDKLGVPKR